MRLLPVHVAGLPLHAYLCRLCLPWRPQVHELVSVTAVQEAQRSAVAAFEDFMDAAMDGQWQQVGRVGCARSAGPVQLCL
jgi:hypothetical protein